jgi:hypothetical protein
MPSIDHRGIMALTAQGTVIHMDRFRTREAGTLVPTGVFNVEPEEDSDSGD